MPGAAAPGTIDRTPHPSTAPTEWRVAHSGTRHQAGWQLGQRSAPQCLRQGPAATAMSHTLFVDTSRAEVDASASR